MTYRRGTGLETFAHPLRPTARPGRRLAMELERQNPGRGRRLEMELERQEEDREPSRGEGLYRSMREHFERGPQTLRPQLYRGPMTTITMAPPSQLQGMEDFRVVPDPGLGFSLKPPKFLRKAAKAVGKAVKDTTREVKHLATIKNIAIATGAVLAAPFVLPALASGAGLLASGAATIGRGAFSALKAGGGFIGREAGDIFGRKAGGPDSGFIGPPAPADTSGGTSDASALFDRLLARSAMAPPSSAAAGAGGGGAPTMPSDGGVSAGGGGGSYGGGGIASPTAGDDMDTSAPPSPAGMFGGTTPLVIGAVALGGLYLVSRAVRKSRASKSGGQ